MKERLDKIISAQMNITRSNAVSLIRSGVVFVNGSKAKSGSDKLDGETDDIRVNGEKLNYSEFVYIMMNKPAGVVSASRGDKDITVVDILPEKYKRKNLFPAGRLDKDTVGFVLITDDGDFAHRILSPKNHITKTYIALLREPLNESDKERFKEGIVLKDGTECLSAEVEPADLENPNYVRVKIREGKYHQIKRMFASLGNEVMYLKRTDMGNLHLDENLKEGECRYITEKELKLIEMQEK